MGSLDDEAPRLSEIGRLLGSLNNKIDDFRGEVRAALSEKVSKEVYDAQVGALRDRVVALENRARSTTNTIYGGLATIIVAAVITWMGLK